MDSDRNHTASGSAHSGDDILYSKLVVASSTLPSSGGSGGGGGVVMANSTSSSGSSSSSSSDHHAVLLIDESSPLASSSLSALSSSSASHFPSVASPVSGAFPESFYEHCAEPERWRLFVAQLARLDAVPVLAESISPSPHPPSDADPLMSPPMSASAASPSAMESGGDHHQQQQQPLHWSASSDDHDHDHPHHDDDLRHGSDSAHDHAASLAASGHYASRFWDGVEQVMLGVRLVLRKTGSLFKGESRSLTIKLVLTWFFLAFAYYGLTMVHT